MKSFLSILILTTASAFGVSVDLSNHSTVPITLRVTYTNNLFEDFYFPVADGGEHLIDFDWNTPRKFEVIFGSELLPRFSRDISNDLSVNGTHYLITVSKLLAYARQTRNLDEWAVSGFLATLGVYGFWWVVNIVRQIGRSSPDIS